MAWLQVEQSMINHRKTLGVSARLGIPPVVTRGHLVTLWCWGLDNAEGSGLIPCATPAMIAEAADWAGDPEKFFSALKIAKYLDVKRERVYFHDWPDYAGRLMEKRAANARRVRNWRFRNKPAACEEHSNDDVTRTVRARTGATVPNRTVPKSNEEDSGTRREGSGEPTSFPSPPERCVEEPPDVTPSERQLLAVLKGIPGYPLDYATDLAKARLWAVDFPALDLIEEAKKWSDWLSNPGNRVKNHRLSFRNWLGNAKKFAEKPGAGQRGNLARQPRETPQVDRKRLFEEEAMKQ